MNDAYFLDLPLTPYQEALDLQRAAVAARISGRLPADLVLLVEHPPVFTLGRRGGLDNLTVDRTILQEKGIQVHQIERGGNITYHGPGQLVVYPIINISLAKIKVVAFVTALEAAMACTAGHWGIEAGGDPANRGTWVGSRKLGSIGITIRRGVAFHGLALNVNTDLTPFQWMNPCGVRGCEVTSMAAEYGERIPMVAVRSRMKHHLTEIMGLNAKDVDLEFLKPYL